MSFKDNIINMLKEKGLSETTINTYMRNLKKLNDDLEIKNFNFLKNCDETIAKMSQLKPNTIKSYLIAICSILKLFTSDKKIEKLYNCYFEFMKNKNNEIRNIPSEKLSDTQKENWVDFDEILNKQKELGEEVNKFIKNKEINETQYNILLSYVVLSLYSLMPSRRNKDYLLMMIVKKWDNKMTDKNNYIDLSNSTFIFNQFKTSKIEGVQYIHFGKDYPELKIAIDKYLKFRMKNIKLQKNDMIPFLVKYDGTPLSKNINSITVILNKIFYPKKISSSMIRHARNTDAYGDFLKEVQKNAKVMAHSPDMALKYVKDTSDIDV